ncbi:TrkH family potassium uptake protein [Bizionia sp.]|uniref:TrkH family potassium uptake protein n=1 Tax=Bizionia sp. TaxID=1954480 RepID=UPI003A8FD71A
MTFNLKLLSKITFWISLIGIIAIISDFGFSQTDSTQRLIDGFYFFVLAMGLISTVGRYIKKSLILNKNVFTFDFLSVLFTLWIFYLYLFIGTAFETDLLLENPIWLQIAISFTFIREFSDLEISFKRAILNPAQLFVISFIFIILIGSFLLILPNATYTNISYLDALFTSTSAVCVTGLAVVDTETHFTTFGQSIIMVLIQLGGLGILTFASYFTYFFKGVTTYENQLILSDLMSSKKLGDVFSVMKYIILVAFGIELFSAILIYSSLDASKFSSVSEQIFFSAFHAISAFCNAGFSTVSASLYDDGFRFNYFLQLIVIFTFVLGGLGFPIVMNILMFLKYKVSNLFNFSITKAKHRPWVLNINSRITLITTVSISLVAFIIFYVLEYNNTLAEHSGFGKIVTALFGATTPRTAGFNTIDTSAMLFPTTMMVFLLMWIGASPQSTGGGIKTSTFAIAILNILSLAKGKSRIEVFRREIAEVSVRRAFAIMSLSLVVIGSAIIGISFLDPEKELKNIAFECFSAYSTVGLSLGITADLSNASKLIIIAVMFIGRISMLTLLIAVFRQIKQKNYKYPVEEITIN